MTDPNLIILYVDSPATSAAFYADLLGKQPAEAATGGGGEIAFAVEGADTVRAMHADCSRHGLRVTPAPTEMDFGHCFGTLDPDGHRLRVFAPTPQQLPTGLLAVGRRHDHLCASNRARPVKNPTIAIERVCGGEHLGRQARRPATPAWMARARRRRRNSGRSSLG
jgi:hypothetical protein